MVLVRLHSIDGFDIITLNIAYEAVPPMRIREARGNTGGGTMAS